MRAGFGTLDDMLQLLQTLDSFAKEVVLVLKLDLMGFGEFWASCI